MKCLSAQKGDKAVNELQAAYRQGFIDACEAFAWWKDGRQFCGTSVNFPLQKVLANPTAIYGYDATFGERDTSETEPKS